jgi:hypothetical protein
MKTHFTKIKNPNYLGSWDLMKSDGTFQNVILTIKEAKSEEITDHRGQKESAALLYFEGYKPMILNLTNIKAVAKSVGSPFIEDWEGKKIEITVKKVKAFGDMHDALRVLSKPVSNQPKPKPTISEDRFEKALEAVANGTVTPLSP